VWTGAQAKERKLVDELGGFDQAVAMAARKANIEDDYKVRYYPRKKPFLEQLTAQLEGNIKSDRIDAELGELKIWYQQLQKVKTYQGIQARMPFELNIH
jgi:protease IV